MLSRVGWVGSVLFFAVAVPPVLAMKLEELGPIQVGFNMRQLRECPRLLVVGPRGVLKNMDSTVVRPKPGGPRLLNLTWHPEEKVLEEKKSGLLFAPVDQKEDFTFKASLPVTPELEGFSPSMVIRLDDDEFLHEEMTKEGFKSLSDVPGDVVAVRLWQIASETLIKPLAPMFWETFLRQAGQFKGFLKPGLSIDVRPERVVVRLTKPLNEKGDRDPSSYEIDFSMKGVYLFVNVSEIPSTGKPQKGFRPMSGFPSPGIRQLHENIQVQLVISKYFMTDGRVYEKLLRTLVKSAFDLES